MQQRSHRRDRFLEARVDGLADPARDQRGVGVTTGRESRLEAPYYDVELLRRAVDVQDRILGLWCEEKRKPVLANLDVGVVMGVRSSHVDAGKRDGDVQHGWTLLLSLMVERWLCSRLWPSLETPACPRLLSSVARFHVGAPHAHPTGWPARLRSARAPQVAAGAAW